MSALTLQLRDTPPTRIDCSAYTPDGLAGKTLDEIRRLPLWVGNRLLETGRAVRGGRRRLSRRS